MNRSRILNTLKVYLSLPEMRLFWIFLFLVAAAAAIDFFEIGGAAYLKLGLFVILGAVVFINNLRLARSNLEIKIERNQLKSVISNLKDGVVAYDPDFKILLFNLAAEEIFGVSASEVVGEVFDPTKTQTRRLERLTQAMFPSLAPLVINRVAPGVYPQVSDISFENPKMELRIITAKIVDQAGRLLGFLKVVRDRTREKELLRQKSEFIALAAHQLRTPLTGIAWGFEELAKTPLPDDSRVIVSQGLGSSRRLLDVVNDLLDVAKIEEGRFGYQFEKVELVDFLEKALAKAAALAQNYGVKVYFDRPLSPIAVYADPRKLAAAVSNILDNAVKYNISGGEVTVRIKTAANDPFAEVSVADTGVGVSPDDIDKLFTKFFRGENAKKLQTEGSGLGLYIAKNVILRHGGRIWAESALSRGSVFYFTLPTDLRLIPPKEIVYEEE